MILIMVAILFGILSAAVALLMGHQTNKELRSGHLEDIDSQKNGLYKSGPLMWCLLAGIAVVSSGIGYALFHKLTSVIPAIEMAVCYLAVLAATVIDLKTRTIPNIIPLTLVITRLAIFAVELFLTDAAIAAFISSLASGLLCVLVLIIANKLSRGGIGGGDIKLLAGIGFLCGLSVVAYTMLISLIVCTLVSVVLLLLKKCSAKDQLPFGPFVYLGYLIMCLILLN